MPELHLLEYHRWQWEYLVNFETRANYWNWPDMRGGHLV